MRRVTPVEVKAARLRLGMTQAQLAAYIELGKDGRRIVRGWEKGERRPSGPVCVLLRYMLRDHEAGGLIRSPVPGNPA